MNSEIKTKLKKAKKEINEAQKAVLDAAKSSDGKTKESLIYAEMSLEKAQAQVDESEE